MTISFQLRRPLRFDAFTIEEALTHILVNEVAKRRPKTIIEFGSGMSTVLIAKVLEVLDLEATRFLSFEEDERFVKRTMAWLKSEGLADRARVLHAPIEVQQGSPWYAERAFDRVLTLDPNADTPAFVFVDGPSVRGDTDMDGPHVRWPGLALTSWLWMQPGSAALVDDTKRDVATVERWHEDFYGVQWTEFQTERGAMLVEPKPEGPVDPNDAIASAA